MIKSAVIAAVVAATAMTACSGSLTRVTPEMAVYAGEHWEGIGAADLEQGRSLFVLKCASCHSLPSPRDCTAGKWPEELRVMGKKSKISAEQSNAILHFLIAAREAPVVKP